jgi:large subunit ribosomal protein L33
MSSSRRRFRRVLLDPGIPMSKSDKRPIIKLKSTAGTGYTYVTRKNKTNTRERIEIKKYDPRIRQHVMFKEER